MEELSLDETILFVEARERAKPPCPMSIKSMSVSPPMTNASIVGRRAMQTAEH